MAILNSITSVLRTFGSNQKGTTAITFALAVVPMLLCAGIAVDYMRYANARTELQAALDASALAVAAAANLSNPARIAAGEATFDDNIAAQNIDAATVNKSFKFNAGAVVASASYELPTALMQLAGFSKMNVDVATEISVPDKKKAEIALVLDYSGSMKESLAGEVKYVAMKNAARKLVTDLKAANPKNIKIGLVPFSHHVWLTLPKQHVLGQTGTGIWTGCTQDRKYPYNLKDDTPVAAAASKWGQAVAKVHAGSDCSAYVPKHLTVMPLTDDLAAVNSQLDAMKPYAWTHIALGAEFGFHLLSPNEPFSEGAPYGTKTTQKFMILLTDGMQTEPGFGSGSRSVEQGEANLEAICSNAKAQGITIMTIAYDIDDNDTVKRLRDCTTDPDKHFFRIGNGNNIAGAFDEIKKEITAQVFISK
jgi:Flp pilus assembly protein TadG